MDNQDPQGEDTNQLPSPSVPVTPPEPAQPMTGSLLPNASAPIASEPSAPVVPTPPVETTQQIQPLPPVQVNVTMPGPGPVLPPSPPQMPPVALPPTEQDTEEPAQLPLRPKRKTLSAVVAVLVLFLVAGLAGSAYYVSTQLTQRTAIAPTAPESEPQAAEMLQVSCDENNRDKPKSNEITFPKNGKVMVFTRKLAGTIELRSQIETITLRSNGGEAEENPTTFNVSGGSTYTIAVKVDGETIDAYGWIPNKATDICGPTKLSGDPLQGYCGEEASISQLLGVARSRADIIEATPDGAAIGIECWGDALKGDQTQDYDYNDFTVVFGYEKTAAEPTPTETPTPSPTEPIGGMCLNVRVAVKDATGKWVRINVEDVPARVGVGDVIRLLASSSAGTKAIRFKAETPGGAPVFPNIWVTGKPGGAEPSETGEYFAEMTVSVAGPYYFEAQSR